MGQFSLNPAIAQHIDRNGADQISAARFLECHVGRDLIKVWKNVRLNAAPKSDLARGSRFLLWYGYTESVRKEEVSMRYRILFMYISWHQWVVKVLNANSEGNWNQALKDKAKLTLRPAEHFAHGKGASLDEMISQIEAWSKKGRKLARLTKTFGMGVVFYVGHVLTDNV